MQVGKKMCLLVEGVRRKFGPNHYGPDDSQNYGDDGHTVSPDQDYNNHPRGARLKRYQNNGVYKTNN